MENNKSLIKTLFSGEILNDALFPYPKLDEEQKESVEMKLDSLESIFQFNENPSNKEDIELCKKMKLGGLPVSRKYNGFGFNFQMYSKILDYLVKYNPFIGATIGIYHSPVLYIINKYGSNKLKEKYLSRIAEGNLCSYALYDNTNDISKYQVERTIAEPSHIETNTEEKNKYYKLKGEKKVINADYSNIFIVFARTEKGLTCFVIDKSSSIEFNKNDSEKENQFIKTSIINLDNINVPAENLIGDEGEGLTIAVEMMSIARIFMGLVFINTSKNLIKKCLPICIDKDKSYSLYNNRSNNNETISETEELETADFKNKHKVNIVNIAKSVYLIENTLTLLTRLIDDDNEYEFVLEASLLKNVYTNMMINNLRFYQEISEYETNDEDMIKIKSIVTDFELDKTLLGDDDDLFKYVAEEGLKIKQSEINEYNKKVDYTNKQIQSGFRQFGEVATKTFSTLAKGFDILAGKESQVKKTQKLLAGFNELKSDIDTFNKSVEKNTKSLFDISLQGMKNIKEELLDFLPNDLIGMTTIKKVSEILHKARTTFNLYLNLLRQESRTVIKKDTNIDLVPSEEKLYISELSTDMMILGSSVSKTEQLITQNISDDMITNETIDFNQKKNYYINMLDLFGKELRSLTKFNSMFDGIEDKNKLTENIYSTVKELYKNND